MHFEEKDPTSFAFWKYDPACSVVTVGTEEEHRKRPEKFWQKFWNAEISLFNTDLLLKKKKMRKTVNLFTIFSPTFSKLIWPQKHYFSNSYLTPWNSDEHILRNAALEYLSLKSHSRPFKNGNRACHLLDLESFICFFSSQQMMHLLMRVTLVLAGLLSFKLPGVRLRKNTSPQSNPNI